MAKEMKEKENGADLGGAAQEAAQTQGADALTQGAEERPNRKAFSERFAKRHKDIDFEDKEARYGAMNEDADALSRYEEDGKALSEMFDQNRWLAAMAMDLRKNPDMSPIEWMAKQGIDIGAAMQDEEMGKKVAQQIADFQQKKADEESHEKELVENLKKSADAMEPLGLDEDARAELWEKFFKVIGDAENGTVTTETWQLFKNAQSYDADIASAREQGMMRGRNEKIQNKVKRSERTDVPPSLSTNGGAQQGSKKGSFWDGLTQ